MCLFNCSIEAVIFETTSSQRDFYPFNGGMVHSEKKLENGIEKEHSKTAKVACFKCSSFYITHDANFPYGCRAMGFKSRALPFRITFKCSGIDCQMFSPKKK